MEANYRAWNNEHALLRQQLEQDKNYPAALETFLRHHAAVHAVELDLSGGWSCADEILAGLNESQMRAVPQGGEHSVVWALWHIARIEDVTLNILLADAPQVFQSQGWQKKVGSPYDNVGNEMSPEEIVRLSEAVDLKALMDYRLTVGRRTREIVRSLNFAELQKPPSLERLNRIAEAGAVGEKAAWLLDYWGGKPATNLLLMPATRHCFVHLNEVRRMIPKLKRLPLSLE
jgi:hypothetical protein